MKTNSRFDFTRFGRLMVYDLKLNGTAYLLKLAAFILLLYLWLVYQMRQRPDEFMLFKVDGQFVNQAQGYVYTFLVGLIFLGMFLGTSFSAMGNKVKRTLYLQLPASTMEKYLQSIFIRIVVGTGLFFLVFWMDAQLARLTFEQIPIGNLTGYIVYGQNCKPQVFDYSMIFNKETPWAIIVPVFVAMGTFLFACPLFFRKYQLLKSILVFFIVIFLVICLLVILSHIFYPAEVNGFDVEFKGLSVFGKVTNADLFLVPLAYLSWLYFLVIGYFRLKESKL